MSKVRFDVGSGITWTQYASRDATAGAVRRGVVWALAPKFPGVFGFHRWVIPDERYSVEASAILVRLTLSEIHGRPTAEVREDSPAYTQYSMRDEK